MRILVLAPLRAGVDHATDDPWTRPIRFEHTTFDQTMANVGPSLVVDHKTREERSFKKLRDFDEAPATRVTAASLLDDILNETEGNAPEKHREIAALELAWRGLAFLARHAPEGAIVEALDAAHDAVDEVLAAIAKRGEPYDLIVVDHTIDTTARDLDRVLRWAELGEGLATPIVCGGTPALAGHDDVAALGRSQRRMRASDDPRAVRFRSVAAKDATRWIAIALNGSEHASAPILVGALALESFAKTGWAAGVARARLPGVTLEAAATEEAAHEAAATGLIVVLPDGSLAAAPVVYRGSSSGGGTAPAASLGLGDQLFMARISQLVMELAAAIPNDTPENVARETALVALNELFAETPGKKPSFEIAVRGMPAVLEVTVRPRGFAGVGLEEATLGAALG